MLWRKTTAAVLAASLMLNGYATAMLWGMNNPFSQTTRHQTVANDHILAFGIVAQNHSQLEKGSLVMMGGKYWFVVNPKDSAELTGILNVKLDKQFQMVQYNPRYAYEALPVELETPDSQTFKTDFCLRYDTDKAADLAKLEKLSFKPSKLDGQTVYTRCISAAGKYYATPQNLSADYRFEQSVPVNLYYRVSRKHTDAWKLTANVLQTPMALMMDAAGAVLMLPVAVIGAVKK